MTARLRPELAELPVYVPGKTVPGAIKLASNETVQGPLPSVRAAIERATDRINRYPDNRCTDLKSALAKHLNSGRVGSAGGWAPEHIAVGCGSVSLCQQLIQISATAGDEVLFGWRSFEIYPLQVRLAGATTVQIPLSDHTFDLLAMRAAVTDRTRLIFICNPNNPTSTVVDPEALARFVDPFCFFARVRCALARAVRSVRSCLGLAIFSPVRPRGARSASTCRRGFSPLPPRSIA